MRGRRRTLRELLAELRLSPEERSDVRAEECMEALFDLERCACLALGEREEAELEAERRRWAEGQRPDADTSRSPTAR